MAQKAPLHFNSKHHVHTTNRICNRHSKNHETTACAFQVHVSKFPVRAQPGENSNIVCNVQSTSEVTVEWWKDGNKLTKFDEHHKIYLNEYEIQFKPANPMQEGEYTCRAIKTTGEATDEATTRLEIISDRVQCDVNHCNQGTCYMDKDGSNRICKCFRGWEGKGTCNMKILEQGGTIQIPNSTQWITITVYVVLSLIVFLIIMTVIVRKLCKTHSQNGYCENLSGDNRQDPASLTDPNNRSCCQAEKV